MIVRNIKALCNKRGLGINALEKATGIGTNTIYKWSTCSPTVKNLKLVADYLGCTVDDLVKEDAHAKDKCREKTD